MQCKCPHKGTLEEWTVKFVEGDNNKTGIWTKDTDFICFRCQAAAKIVCLHPSGRPLRHISVFACERWDFCRGLLVENFLFYRNDLMMFSGMSQTLESFIILGILSKHCKIFYRTHAFRIKSVLLQFVLFVQHTKYELNFVFYCLAELFFFLFATIEAHLHRKFVETLLKLTNGEKLN